MPEEFANPNCPKCGHPRPLRATECARCGIIFQRYQGTGVHPRKAPPRATYVPPARLESVFEGVSQALSAGVTLRAVAAAGALEPLPAPVAGAFRTDIEAGLPFSGTLERLGLLDPGMRAVIQAAEVRGELPNSLRLASAEIARRRKQHLHLLLGLAYPLFLLLVAVVVLPLPLAFGKGSVRLYLITVVPRLVCIVALVLLGSLVLPRLGPSSALRRSIRWIGLRTPIVRQAALSDALSSFVGVLGACIKAGLPARESLTLAARASAPHPAFEGSAKLLVEAIDRGDTLVDALRRIKAIPATDLAQVGTAEISGTLDAVLLAMEARHRDRARVLWWTMAGVIAGAIFLGVVGLVVAQIIGSWTEVFRSQSQQIDRLMR